MASDKDTQIGEADDKIQMLKEALKCVNGTLDFDKLADKMNVANGEAMRKRFKRFFEKDEEPIQIKGSTLGNLEEGATVPKTPRTPKLKAAKLTTSGDDDPATPKAKSTGRKRKATEVSEDSQGTNNEVADKEVTATIDTTPISDDDAANGSPKKKARKTPAKPRKSAKAPQTPPITKPPGTPKAPLTQGLNLGMQDPEDEEAKEYTSDCNDKLTNVKKDGDAKTHGVTVGSPAIQAKTDVLIKATEEANGGAMGEPAKQAKRDTVETNMKAGVDG